ncbi:MAG TPA: enoyl-CoA hydratase/isomerase family protein [Comamonadaceae bacterium]|nr:enoyl-CoA hydratase/isomerase family protein [Comamonadaceae bacterium]
MSKSFERIAFEVQDGVATLTLDNPAKRNAFDPTMRVEMAEVVRQVQADPAIRALVLTGAGAHFCSGGDLANIAASGLDNGGWRQRLSSLHDWLKDLMLLDKPVVAAVDGAAYGAAYGAGFSLALAADFIIASNRARFAMSFIRVGVVPDCAAFYTLPRVVGVQRARELMLSGREVSAQEALQLGIATELVASDALQARAQAIACSFVGASPVALSLIKRSLALAANDLPSLLEQEANAQALAMGTPEHREAVHCFLEKKPMPFQWPQA